VIAKRKGRTVSGGLKEAWSKGASHPASGDAGAAKELGRNVLRTQLWVSTQAIGTSGGGDTCVPASGCDGDWAGESGRGRNAARWSSLTRVIEHRTQRAGPGTRATRTSVHPICGWHAGTDVELMGCKSPDPNRPFGDLAGGQVCGASHRLK
jgi:hypothetical protein